MTASSPLPPRLTPKTGEPGGLLIPLVVIVGGSQIPAVHLLLVRRRVRARDGEIDKRAAAVGDEKIPLLPISAPQEIGEHLDLADAGLAPLLYVLHRDTDIQRAVPQAVFQRNRELLRLAGEIIGDAHAVRYLADFERAAQHACQIRADSRGIFLMVVIGDHQLRANVVEHRAAGIGVLLRVDGIGIPAGAVRSVPEGDGTGGQIHRQAKITALGHRDLLPLHRGIRFLRFRRIGRFSRAGHQEHRQQKGCQQSCESFHSVPPIVPPARRPRCQ